MTDPVKVAMRDVSKYRRALADLNDYVKAYIVLLDQAMRIPDQIERGKRVAFLQNRLEYKNDYVHHFLLDGNLRRKPRKVYLRQIENGSPSAGQPVSESPTSANSPGENA